MAAYCIQTNLVCITLLLMIYGKLRHRMETRSAQQLAFCDLILAACVMCVSDVVAWLSNGETFQGAAFLVEAGNIIYCLSITLCCYAWHIYVSFRLNGLEYDHKREMLLSAIPLIVMGLVLCTNPLTHFVFSVDSANVYRRGSGIVLHWLISWGYLVYAEIRVIRAIRRLNTRSAKEKLNQLLWFFAAPAAAAVAQMIFYGTTTMQCGITFSIIMITFTFLQEKVSRDTLTGLNNRAALEAYLTEQLAREQRQMTVMMCDIDAFKQINDSLGHLVGDLALKSTAEILKDVCAASSEPVFLCRYGGDEFLICTTSPDSTVPEKLSRAISEALGRFNEGSRNVFSLSLSIGVAGASCATVDDVEQAISAADDDMYLHKREKKAAR